MSGKDLHREASLKRKREAANSIDSDSQESSNRPLSSSRLQVPLPPAPSPQLRLLVKQPKAGRDYSQVPCYNCGNLGHYSNRCPSPKNLIPRIYYRCQKPGHSVAPCSASQCKKFRILRGLPKDSLQIPGQLINCSQAVDLEQVIPTFSNGPPKAPESVAEPGNQGNLEVVSRQAYDPEQPGCSRIVAYYDSGYFDLDV